MKVILKEDLKNIGKSWEVVDVKDGFARNYLIPNKLAVIATTENLKAIETDKKKRELEKSLEKSELEALAAKISSLSCTIQAASGEEDKLFGSVTTEDIAKSLQDEGINIDKKQIFIEEPIKKLGVYQAKIKLNSEVAATLKFWVVKKSA